MYLIGYRRCVRWVCAILMYVGLLLLMMLMSTILTKQASAKSSPSWTSAAYPTILTDDDQSKSVPGNIAEPRRDCVNEKIYVDPKPGLPYADVLNNLTACVYHLENFRLALYKRPYKNWYDSSFSFEESAVISIGPDIKMYRINGLPTTLAPIATTSRGDLLYKFGGNPGGYSGLGMINVYKNILQNIHRIEGSSPHTYQLDSTVHTFFKRLDGTPQDFNMTAVSNNNRWMVAEIPGGGFLRIDLLTSETRFFTDIHQNYVTDGYPHFEGAISDDGTDVMISSKNGRPLTAFTIDESCGNVGIPTTSSPLPNRCTDKNLSSFYTMHNMPSGMPRQMSFSSDGGMLEYVDYVSPQLYRWKTMIAPGYEPTEHLKYLALGDSYSSGEGDVEKRKDGSAYYLKGTQDNGGCHISSRSYPFLLARYYDIPDSKVKTIACSGARVVEDYISDSVRYTGQAQQLAGQDAAAKIAIQDSAINAFTPGVLPQLDFIKRYKPEVITLTGGGNDVGFAKVLTYCASEGGDACGYADEESDLHKLLYSSIDTQYQHTITLLSKIRQYSPDTRVILVGYPKFVESGRHLCSYNAGKLNSLERNMVNNAVVYMNGMLNKAAETSGVSFVDVEDSLAGGRLCGGGRYVTGLHSLGFQKIKYKEFVESFHPNARGHAMIAQTIESTNIFEVPAVATPSLYQLPDSNATSIPWSLIESGEFFLTDKDLHIITDDYSFAPNSSVVVTLYSDPMNLGVVTADDSGSVDAMIARPDVHAGHHVLVLTGISYSGEPIKYFQFVDANTSVTDRDGDGVSDDLDTCDFIEHWYDEESGVDVCAQQQGATHPVAITQELNGSNSHFLRNATPDIDQRVTSNSSGAITPSNRSVQISPLTDSIATGLGGTATIHVPSGRTSNNLPIGTMSATIIIITLGGLYANQKTKKQ